MTVTFLFWFFMLCWLLFRGYEGRSTGYGLMWGGGLIPWLAVFLVGYKVFGWPISG